MFTIAKDFAFSASHQLTHLPPEHPCARLHGHNYVVRAEVSGELDERGFVVDFAEFAPLGGWIDDHLDHRHLNDVMEQPTSERLAALLLERLAALAPAGASVAVGVSETPKTWAWCRP